MRLIPIIIFIVLFSGCNGELEHPVQKVINVQAVQIKEVKKIPKEKFKPVFNKKRQIAEEEFLPLKEEKEPELTDDIIQRSEKYNELMTPLRGINLDDGFKEVGNYGIKTGCPSKIYRKDYEVSYLYIFMDCKNNHTKQIVRK